MTEHWEVLPKATSNSWSRLADSAVLKQFYLAGGTGLALQIGHRISNDLDFFTEHTFDPDILVQRIRVLEDFELEMKEEQTVAGIFHNTKLSFLGYAYPLLEELRTLCGIRVASIMDIACMKVDAIASRGAKRDFIDLFFITRGISLLEILKLFERKYVTIKYNMMHIKKGLVYFEDADSEPMPDMLTTVEWGAVKAFFLTEVPKLI